MDVSKKVELWPSLAQAEAARQRMARSRSEGMFGVRTTSLERWVLDLWSVHGDGREVIGGVERDMLIASILGNQGASGVRAGVVRLVSSVVAEASGLAPFERAVEHPFDLSLSEAERELLGVVRRYRDALRALGLVEYGEALACLPSALGRRTWCADVTLRAFDEMRPAEESFVDALRSLGFRVSHDRPCAAANVPAEELCLLSKALFGSSEPAIVPTGCVRVLLPTGRYARGPLLADEVSKAALESRSVSWDRTVGGYPVVVVCKGALETFDELSPRLAASGVSCAVRGSRPFGDTAFGRAFLSLARFIGGSESTRSASMLSDFAASPFSGLEMDEAFRFDAEWRRDRDLAFDGDALLALLEERCAWAGIYREVAEGGDALQVKPLIERFIRSRTGWDDAFRAEQAQALSVLVEFGNAALRFDVPFLSVLDMLAASPVPVSTVRLPRSCSDCAPGAVRPEVLVCEEAYAATLPERSCQVLFSCDMSSAAYPVRAERGAKETLFEKLGIALEKDALARARARFSRVVSVPFRRLDLERELNTVDADEAYPSVMFEEALDCYRRDVTSDEDLDRTYRVPVALLGFVLSRGEEAASRSVFSGELALDGIVERELAPTGAIGEGRRDDIVVTFSGGRAALSPTQVESYLECPYKWFSLRRLRLERLDMGFGSMEMGIFVHDVMAHFYEALQKEAPERRVVTDNVEEAEALVRRIFAERFARQRGNGKSTRVAPVTSMEAAQVDELAEKIARFVRQEAEFLPGFVPRHFELEFGKGEPFVYAGCALVGGVDRIDVDDEGRAVIVDYKGSLGGSSEGPYMLLPKDRDESVAFMLPRKVQALMYAQVARRRLGLEPVGALYVNYANGAAAGAIDDRVIDPALARMSPKDRKRCSMLEAGFGSFADLLDEVESGIEESIARLLDGDVLARPSGPDACKYCPVKICDRDLR